MLRTALIAALAAAAIPAPAPAHSWKIGHDSYRIYFDDLDLGQRDGRAAALDRVERAAARLCADAPVAADRRACAGAVLEDAAARRPALARALQERDGTALAQR